MIKLIGIPFDKNSSFLRGPALAPQKIRQVADNGAANFFSEKGLHIEEGKVYKDEGDLSFKPDTPKNIFQQIHEFVLSNISSSDRLISLGGDHSISYPLIDAHTDIYDNLNVLHFDAHSDLYKNFDENPYSHASPFARLMEKGKIRSLTQVGIRTLNEHQRSQAKEYGVEIIEMKDFSTGFLNKLKGPLYVTLDMDVLDPAFAPGISHHEPGGLSTRQLIEIIQQINAPIVGADLVEYNPVRDVHDITAMVAFKLLKELIHVIYEEA